MKGNSFLELRALVGGLLLLSMPTASVALVQYAVTDLGTLGGTESFAGDINNRGQVVGWSRTTGDAARHAFLYSGSGPMQDFGDCSATGINDSGQVVGSVWISGDVAFHAFRTAANQPINPATDDLGTLGETDSLANGINNSGQVVGHAYTSVATASHVFRTAANQPINPATDDLGTFGGIPSYPTGINNSGQVVGFASSFPGDNVFHAFRTAANSPINPATDDLGTFGGRSSLARDINNSGQVVGGSNTSGDIAAHAFRTAPNSPLNPATDDLGTLGGSYSEANGINNSGQVVGYSATSGNAAEHAFLYSGGGPIKDLNNLIAPGSGLTLTEARAINDKGQIVGYGTNAAGQKRAFLLSYTASTPPVQPPVDPPPPPPSGKKNLVLYTHGWNTSEADWTDPNGCWRKLDQALKANVNSSNWDVMGVDWPQGFGNILGPDFALNVARELGAIYGKMIADGNYEHVHLIAHSAGSNLISTAAAVVAAKSPGTVIQTTYLDPYAPGSFYTNLYGSHRDQDWSDSYIVHDPTPYTYPILPNAHNVDVSWLDPNVKVDLFGNPWSSHGWPIDFYVKTILATIPGAGDYGYPRSLEGGGWDTRSSYPLGNNPVILGGPGIQMPGTIERHDAALNFSALANVTSDTGTVSISGTGFSLATGSPVWMSSLVIVTKPVNTLTFDAEFLSSGAEGLLAVYWDDQYVGQIDERYVLEGSQQYSLFLPGTFDPDAYSLAFRLDSYTGAQSNVVIGNVATGYTAVPEPSTLVLLGIGAIGLLGYAWRRRRS